MAEVAAFIGALGIPTGFRGIDLIKAAADIGAPTDIIKNEKLVFRAEIGGIGNASRFQIGFGVYERDAPKTLLNIQGVRLDHITRQD